MSHVHVFYSAMPGLGSGFKPFEAEQAVQHEFPGAVTATLSDRVTDKEEIRKLFMEWLGKIWLCPGSGVQNNKNSCLAMGSHASSCVNHFGLTGFFERPLMDSNHRPTA